MCLKDFFLEAFQALEESMALYQHCHAAWHRNWFFEVMACNMATKDPDGEERAKLALCPDGVPT